MILIEIVEEFEENIPMCSLACYIYVNNIINAIEFPIKSNKTAIKYYVITTLLKQIGK